MRSYPVDSPEAAVRIVALTMLADGHVSPSEFELLRRCERLGLDADRLHDVLLALCEDLLQGAGLTWADACRLDDQALARLLAEIEEPALRRHLIDLCRRVAEADGRITDAELRLLAQAFEHWGSDAYLPPARLAYEQTRPHAG